MKKLSFALLICGMLTMGLLPADTIIASRTSCGIVEVLESQSLPANSFAVTGFGNYEEASEVIIPVDINTGIYSERLTRKTNNLYKVDRLNLYIKTRMCYEYAFSKEAIIEITSYGGEVTFK